MDASPRLAHRSAAVFLPAALLIAAVAGAAEPPRASAPLDAHPLAQETQVSASGGSDSLSAAFAKQADARKAPGPLAAMLELLVLAYREGFSPVDGPSCPFHPSCSRFARQAVGRHGPVAGILMAGDRLLRCNGSGRDRYPRVGPEGKLHDPPPP